MYYKTPSHRGYFFVRDIVLKWYNIIMYTEYRVYDARSHRYLTAKKPTHGHRWLSKRIPARSIGNWSKCTLQLLYNSCPCDDDFRITNHYYNNNTITLITILFSCTTDVRLWHNVDRIYTRWFSSMSTIFSCSHSNANFLEFLNTH